MSRTRRHAPLEGKLTSSLAPVGATSSLAPVAATLSSLVGTGATSSSLPTSDGIESKSCAAEHQWGHVSRVANQATQMRRGNSHHRGCRRHLRWWSPPSVSLRDGAATARSLRGLAAPWGTAAREPRTHLLTTRLAVTVLHFCDHSQLCSAARSPRAERLPPLTSSHIPLFARACRPASQRVPHRAPQPRQKNTTRPWCTRP